jgi:MFS family permease
MTTKTIKTYYFILFCFNLSMSFFFATYVLFMVEAGLSLTQISLVNAAYMLTCFTMEIPTGSIADNYGRKFSFVLSCVLLSLSLMVYHLSSTFILFILAEVIAGIATTFSSGAFEAWVVDSVKHYDKEYDTAPIFEKKIWVKSVAVFTGVIAGAYLGKIDLALPWLVASIGMLLVAIAAFILMREDYFDFSKSKKRGWSSIVRTVKDSTKYGVQHREVFYIAIVGIVFTFACMAPNMFWQIRFKDLGVDISNMGYIHSGTVIFIALGTVIARFARSYFRKEKYALLFSLVVFAVGMFMASLFQFLPLVFCGFYIHEVARGIYGPLSDYYVNNKIPSEKRATILSFVSMIAMIGAFAGLLTTGWIAENISVSIAWLVGAIVIIISLPFLLLMKNGE